MKGMEKRKARIDTDVMERFKPSCSRCVNSGSDGKSPHWVLQNFGLFDNKKLNCEYYKQKVMFNVKDLCQVCRHYDIGSHKCVKAQGRAVPKGECADYEYSTHDDLCKYCSHNEYGICSVSFHRCDAEGLRANICTYFENKGVMEERLEYKRKEWLCARCANSCKWDCEFDHCDSFVAIEDAERIENANQIAALRKRFEEFMLDIVRDFGNMIVADTAEISETERKNIGWNKEKNIPYTDKKPFIDFSLKFTVYKKD